MKSEPEPCSRIMLIASARLAEKAMPVVRPGVFVLGSSIRSPIVSSYL